MAEPMGELSPQKLNTASNAMHPEDDLDATTWEEPPSSPFISNVENENQENVAPEAAAAATTPVKQPLSFEDDVPQSAFKISPEKKLGLKDRTSPIKMSPRKQSLAEFEEDLLGSPASRPSSKKASPVKQAPAERPGSAMSGRSRRSSPMKTSRNPSIDATPFSQAMHPEDDIDASPTPTPSRRPDSAHTDNALRDNEGLTVAMNIMEQTRSESSERTSSQQAQDADHDAIDAVFEETEAYPEATEYTSMDVDDTSFSMFSEMPGIDMTKFAALRQSPTKNGLADPSTPRARPPKTPSTVQTIRRAGRTPSPTPRGARNENDTTNLLLDFTAQFEAFSYSRRESSRRTSPAKSTTEHNLPSYYQSQRSPAKRGASNVPATPNQSRQLQNLLDFELPPPPTPRSMPTVTIRELESLKSGFQSQISSLTASLSGKEAQVESLVQAVSDAERRVGEAQELVREERSAREHAEAQMEDWKKKGEEVQKLLQDVQAELARNDTEREDILTRLSEAEKRAEEAEIRATEIETKCIEAESKNVDMSTFIDPDENNKKVYSEIECQTAIAEKVNEVARDLHAAYKAKHEKKIKALKDNYQKKADERCKELRVQIKRLEGQVEDAEKKRDDTFSNLLPDNIAHKDIDAGASRPEDLKLLEDQKSEIEHLKAQLAGLQSELESLRRSHDGVLQDLEAERVEKGELVAAAEQMLAMCGEKMGEMQEQQDLRKSQVSSSAPQKRAAPPADPVPSMRSTGFLAGGSAPRPGSALGSLGAGAGARPASGLGHQRGGSAAKPSGLKAPGKTPGGGFGYGGKSRLLSNIERMGGARGGQE